MFLSEELMCAFFTTRKMLTTSVGNCTTLHDGKSLADYIFDINLRVEDIDVVTQRSYLDFCDFDAHIVALLQDPTFKPCPLDCLNEIRKARTKQNNPFGAIRRATLGGLDIAEAVQYTPYFCEERQSYFITQFEISEDIQSKSTELTEWLKYLLADPRVVDFPVTIKFFNPNETSFRKHSSDADSEVTEYDYLVPTKTLKSKQIVAKFSITLEVQLGQILVWRFRSKNCDVAFAIEINGDAVLPLRRYASCKEEILGVMQVPSSLNGKLWGGTAICEMKFENKYAGVL